MNISFGHPYVLLAIFAVIPAVLVFIAGFRRLRISFLPLIVSSSDPAGKTSQSAGKTLITRSVLFACAWVFLVFAAASPRWGSALVPERQQGSSVIFVMDISRSMTLADIPPNRLDFSARYASLLVDRMDNASCGLVLVKGSAVLAVPLTQDHQCVLDLLETLSPSMLSAPGSGTGSGLTTALAAFPETSTASRTIILFTDGDETSGSLVDAARAIRASGTRLVIVGVGTPSGSEINVYPGSEEPRMLRSRLRDDILRSAAKASGRDGLYVNGLDAGSALRVIDTAVAQANASRRLVYSQKPVERYSFFLVFALFFFCAGCAVGGFSWPKKR